MPSHETASGARSKIARPFHSVPDVPWSCAALGCRAPQDHSRESPASAVSPRPALLRDWIAAEYWDSASVHLPSISSIEAAMAFTITRSSGVLIGINCLLLKGFPGHRDFPLLELNLARI